MESLWNLDKILQVIDKILCNRTRSYRNSMKSYYRQDHMKTYRILQYPRASYKMVQDPMGLVTNLRQTWKDSTALCKILRKWNHTRSNRISEDPRQNPINSLLILVKIVWDLRQDFERLTMQWYRILQYPREFYKIVQDPMPWVWDLRKASEDCTALLNLKKQVTLDKILWDLRQDFERLNSIL